MKLKIGARRHEANEWLTSSKIPQFQGQVFSTADAHIAYWCHNSKSSECRELHTGLSSMPSASSPERGQCVPNTSQTVRSRWKRAFPSWSVRFAYTAWIRYRYDIIWSTSSSVSPCVGLSITTFSSRRTYVLNATIYGRSPNTPMRILTCF